MPISLSEWQSFYVIAGSSAAGLTGLMFVVVALAADRLERKPSDGMNAFSTPTVAHFSIVLLLAGIMSMPLHGEMAVSSCVAAAAIGGLISTGLAGVRMGRVQVYTVVAEDWAWHVVLPFIAYMVLLGAALLLGTAQEVALFVMAAVVLALLFIGIRNAWDVAIFLVTVHGVKSGTPAVVEMPAVVAPTPPAQGAPVVTARRDGPGSAKPG